MSEPYTLIGFGIREAGGTWRPLARDAGRILREADDCHRVTLEVAGAVAVEAVFEAPKAAQFLGGGERFDALDLRGQSIRFYLENQALGAGTYLPIPWIATTGGFSLYLDGAEPVTFHLAAAWDPGTIRVQVEGDRLDLELHLGSLEEQYRALIGRIGPPLMPGEAFFGLWKAGDWRFEDATTVAADVEGFRRLGLPMSIKLIDAYWEDEVHSFEFDPRKYPDAWGMVEALGRDGCEVHLWLCPWVVVGTRAHAFAEAQGFTIRDASGRPLTRRPGANPNVVAALIDFSNPAARAWWSTRLASLIERGVAGFKADFGEQLPERAVLHSGETGGAAHNRFVRYYLEATAAAFGDKPPAIISRSGNAKVRTQIWSGDQTSDFCPKSGLPAAIRAAQSASLSGFSFVGSDVGGYFGTPTTQVFVRWSQFACFTPMMQLHGLGCREPWQMEVEAFALFRRYASLHLELLPYFTHHGRIAAQGGAPLIRMMPLAFPDVDWSAINDWDQQFMLGDALLVAPVAFYANTRAVYLPEGVWYDVMAGAWTDGGRWVVRETPLADIPVFIREGSHLYLRRDRSERSILAIAAVRLKPGEAHATIVPEDAGGMPLTRCALLAPEGDIASADEASALETHHWLGQLATLPVPPGRRVSFSLR